jgi:hypothetical protein
MVTELLLKVIEHSVEFEITTINNTEEMSLDLYFLEHKNDEEEIYSANITHNCAKHAKAAGIYECLWRVKEYTKAKELIEPLTEGLQKLINDPMYYRQFDNPNGWGKYDHFLVFVINVLNACRLHPESYVIASV